MQSEKGMPTVFGQCLHSKGWLNVNILSQSMKAFLQSHLCQNHPSHLVSWSIYQIETLTLQTMFEKSLYDLIKGLRSHKGAEEDYIHPIHRSICPRTETVEGLSQLLDEYKVIHVRGAPASGKTTLAKLLERYLRGRRRVVYIPSWKTDNLSATRFLEQENHKSGYTHDRNLLLSGGTDDIVFIIDDVQKTYSGSGLWYSVIKSRFYYNNLQQSNTQELILKHVGDLLENDVDLFRFLELDAITGRGLPSTAKWKELIDPETVSVLLQVLRDGDTRFDPDNKALVRCFELGFVHTELEPTPHEVRCVLPSPLHARYVKYAYEPSPAT